MKIKELKLPWKLYCMGLALIFLILIGSIYCKYAVNGEENSSARVATYSIGISKDSEGNESLPLRLNSAYPGNISYTEFYVSNNKSGRVSEVALKYSLNISLAGVQNLPVTYSIQKYNSTSGAWQTLPAAALQNNTFAAASSQTERYRIAVDWTSGNNSFEYVTEMDMLWLNLNWYQID